MLKGLNVFFIKDTLGFDITITIKECFAEFFVTKNCLINLEMIGLTMNRLKAELRNNCQQKWLFQI